MAVTVTTSRDMIHFSPFMHCERSRSTVAVYICTVAETTAAKTKCIKGLFDAFTPEKMKFNVVLDKWKPGEAFEGRSDLPLLVSVVKAAPTITVNGPMMAFLESFAITSLNARALVLGDNKFQFARALVPHVTELIFTNEEFRMVRREPLCLQDQSLPQCAILSQITTITSFPVSLKVFNHRTPLVYVEIGSTRYLLYAIALCSNLQTVNLVLTKDAPYPDAKFLPCHKLAPFCFFSKWLRTQPQQRRRLQKISFTFWDTIGVEWRPCELSRVQTLFLAIFHRYHISFKKCTHNTTKGAPRYFLKGV